jgi:hypothetical protein
LKRNELFTPDGSFIKCADEDLTGFVRRSQQDHLKIGGLLMKGNTFDGVKIGVWIKKDGSVAAGCG